MTRVVRVAAARMGPVGREESRGAVVERLLVMLRDAQVQGPELVVFPELALTTCFPRRYFEDQADIAAFARTKDTRER